MTFLIGETIYKLLIYLVAIIIFIKIYCLVFLEYGIVIPCFFHKLTGFYCPGCGVTRMLSSLMKLEFYQAFRYNSLIFIALPFIIICIGDIVIKWLYNRQDYFYRKINNKVWVALLIIAVLFGIARNIPIFDYLRPTVI